MWILLHFEKITRHTNRKDLNDKLNKHFIRKYRQDYKKSSQDVYELIIGCQSTAIENAEYLVADRLNHGEKIDPEKNQSTDHNLSIS